MDTERFLLELLILFALIFFLTLTFFIDFMQKTTSTILKICKQVNALLPLQIALKEWNEVQGSQCAIITKKTFFIFLYFSVTNRLISE